VLAVKPGDDDPQQAQQSHHEEWVIDPQSAARIYSHHSERMFVEHAFDGKPAARHKRVSGRTTFAVALVVGLLVAGCLPDPHRTQSVDILDRLIRARALFNEQPPPIDKACGILGDVETHLFGEPGLSQLQPAWSALRDATRALESTCGQNTLLALPARNGKNSQTLREARLRWQDGIQREMTLACDHLRLAAQALNRPAPC
jgi:hypothetical protein